MLEAVVVEDNGQEMDRSDIYLRGKDPDGYMDADLAGRWDIGEPLALKSVQQLL